MACQPFGIGLRAGKLINFTSGEVKLDNIQTRKYRYCCNKDSNAHDACM